MQQPSAQGIASLYRGNPQPLQQSIQKDQQAKPGLPPDLQKMLALQIVTNETDSVTAQKAMDQLKQMGGQQGKPPTVMASLQQQAEQKLKAQAVQAQQKQQGIQALMQNAPASGVPEGTPEPETQPQAQGIDQLPVEFEGAEGGIVAFQSRGEVPESEPASDSMGGFTSDPTREALNALRIEEKYAEENRQKRIAELRQKAEFLEKAGAPQADAVRAQIELEERKASESRPRPAQPERSLPPATQKVVAPPAQEKVIQRPPVQQRPAPTAGLAQLATQMQGATVPTAPAERDIDERIRYERMEADPAAQAAAKKARMDSELGAPNTSQYDRMMDELEKRRAQLEGPQDKYGQLMEYLSQISANSQPGRGSFASGAAGARGVDKLNKERQLQQFELSKQSAEIAQKRLDTVRAYAEKKFNVGETEFDKVYEAQYDAAKETTKSKDAAKKLAQENTLKLLEIESQQRIAANRDATSLATSGIQSESKFIKDWMSKPENKGKSYSDAYAAFKMAGTPSASNRGVMTRDQASDNIAKKLDITNPMRKEVIADATKSLQAAGVPKPSLAQIEEYLIQEQIKGVPLTGTALPSVGAPPPGAVRLKPSGG
jgi:hypothetical protein